jgi:hypothetical protein
MTIATPRPAAGPASGSRAWGGPALALAAVCAVAAVLRVIGIQYGLPAVYNPDEVAIMARALAFAKGSLNPGNFLYPTFYFYVLFAWVGGYLLFVLLTGRAASIAELPRLYFMDPTGIYTAGRMLGVVSGTAGVLVLHRVAARLIDRRTALAAALFLAAAPLHVRDSHYVKHDVFATTVVLIAYLAILRVWPCAREGGPRTIDLVVAGAACGMGFSTHYYCVFLALPLAWAVFHASRGEGFGALTRRLVIAGAAMAGAFVALSPYLAVEPVTAWRDIVANRAIVVDRAVAAGAFAPAMRYLEILATDSMGLTVVLLALLGAIWMTVERPARAVLLLAFPIPFFAFIANTVPASRYLNPILPFAAIFAAWTLVTVTTRLRARPVVLWLLVGLSAAPSVVDSVRADLFIREDDTRTMARRYMESRIPAGATVAIQAYSVPLSPSREGLIEALTRNVGTVEAASTKFQLQLSQDPYPAPAYRLIFMGEGLDADKIYVDYAAIGDTLEPLRRLGVAFVVVKQYNTADPDVARFLAVLSREGRRIAVFSPYRPDVTAAGRATTEPFLHNTDARIVAQLERPGPALEIWQLDGPGS